MEKLKEKTKNILNKFKNLDKLNKILITIILAGFVIAAVGPESSFFMTLKTALTKADLWAKLTPATDLAVTNLSTYGLNTNYGTNFGGTYDTINVSVSTITNATMGGTNTGVGYNVLNGITEINATNLLRYGTVSVTTNGSDVIGARNGNPVATLTNAMIKAFPGDTIIVYPGRHEAITNIATNNVIWHLMAGATIWTTNYQSEFFWDRATNNSTNIITGDGNIELILATNSNSGKVYFINTGNDSLISIKLKKLYINVTNSTVSSIPTIGSGNNSIYNGKSYYEIEELISTNNVLLFGYISGYLNVKIKNADLRSTNVYSPVTNSYLCHNYGTITDTNTVIFDIDNFVGGGIFLNTVAATNMNYFFNIKNGIFYGGTPSIAEVIRTASSPGKFFVNFDNWTLRNPTGAFFYIHHVASTMFSEVSIKGKLLSGGGSNSYMGLFGMNHDVEIDRWIDTDGAATFYVQTNHSAATAGTKLSRYQTLKFDYMRASGWNTNMNFLSLGTGAGTTSPSNHFTRVIKGGTLDMSATNAGSFGFGTEPIYWGTNAAILVKGTNIILDNIIVKGRTNTQRAIMSHSDGTHEVRIMGTLMTDVPVSTNIPIIGTVIDSTTKASINNGIAYYPTNIPPTGITNGLAAFWISNGVVFLKTSAYGDATEGTNKLITP